MNSRTIAGISCSRARCAARQRRSPAMIWKRSPCGRSRIGWSTPRSAIEAASSSSASSSKMRRGWLGLGSIRAISISRRRRAMPVGPAAAAPRCDLAEQRRGGRGRGPLGAQAAHAASASCGSRAISSRASAI
jgi:hypothetical protein